MDAFEGRYASLDFYFYWVCGPEGFLLSTPTVTRLDLKRHSCYKIYWKMIAVQTECLPILPPSSRNPTRFLPILCLLLVLPTLYHSTISTGSRQRRPNRNIMVRKRGLMKDLRKKILTRGNRAKNGQIHNQFLGPTLPILLLHPLYHLKEIPATILFQGMTR